jgi:hypothetical protein
MPRRCIGGVDVWLHAFFDLDTRWRWVVSFTSWPLYSQGKSSWYPLDRRLGGPQSRSGRGSEEENSQPLSGFEPPSVQPVAHRCTTELLDFILIDRSAKSVTEKYMSVICPAYSKAQSWKTRTLGSRIRILRRARLHFRSFLFKSHYDWRSVSQSVSLPRPQAPL